MITINQQGRYRENCRFSVVGHEDLPFDMFAKLTTQRIRFNFLWFAMSDFFLVYDSSASQLKKIQTQYITSPSVSRTATGDGSTTDFTVTDGVTVAQCLVSINGVIQTPTTEYTISGTTLTFGTAPEASDVIQIRELPA